MLEVITRTVGGLGLFILGMTVMSNGLKMSAGKRVKKILSTISSNRIIGFLSGAGITAMIQSSSATTIIIIGFVSAGLMTLQQAIGMILGANVGTTMTAQLIAFNLSDAALPAIAIGVTIKLFTRKKQLRYWGDVILGFGLVFFGMTIMKEGLEPIKNQKTFINFFTTFSPDTFNGLLLSILVGACVTVAVQSSSATIGLTMVMASNGILTFPSAMALVLGENIGTTITAELATIGSKNITVIRTARAHTMFNVIGVSIVIIIFPTFIDLVQSITKFLGAGPVDEICNNGNLINIPRYIANGHTIFNLLNAILFLFMTKWLVKIASILSPKEEDSEEINLYRQSNFSDRLTDMPIAAIAETRSEITRMGNLAKYTFIETIKQIENRNHKKLSKWKRIEIHIDELQIEIMSSLVKLYQSNVGEFESREISHLMRMTNNFERIGDSVENIAQSTEKLIEEKIYFSQEAIKDLKKLAFKVLEFINLTTKGIKLKIPNLIKQANILEDTIDSMREKMRQNHIKRIRSNDCGFEQGLIYINIITNLEKIGDYCFNISRAMNEKNKTYQKNITS